MSEYFHKIYYIYYINWQHLWQHYFCREILNYAVFIFFNLLIRETVEEKLSVCELYWLKKREIMFRWSTPLNVNSHEFQPNFSQWRHTAMKVAQIRIENVKCHWFLLFTLSSKHLDNWATLNCMCDHSLCVRVCVSTSLFQWWLSSESRCDAYTCSSLSLINTHTHIFRVKRSVAVTDMSKLSLHIKHIIQTPLQTVMTYRYHDIKDKHSWSLHNLEKEGHKQAQFHTLCYKMWQNTIIQHK